MALLDRLMQKWRAEHLSHYPLHPHISPDEKAFRECLDIGSTFEEVAKEKLSHLFRVVDPYCDRLTTDVDGRTRAKGKRIQIDGKSYIAPDFAVSNGGSHAYFVDIKSKQYHSYFHREQAIQQCVDVHALHDYLMIGKFEQKAILILLHLWPSLYMGDMGYCDTARIHTGVKWAPLPQEHLEALVQQYPVDDWYYLINAAKIVRNGRIAYDVSIGDNAYFFALRHAIAGPRKGLLPSIEDWYKEAAYIPKES